MVVGLPDSGMLCKRFFGCLVWCCGPCLSSRAAVGHSTRSLSCGVPPEG
ncbi:unnamed protein product [Brassica oleracea var. botrytis]